METKHMVSWLRGFGTAKKGLGHTSVADMIYEAATRLEDLDRRARIAEEQRNQAWDELARLKGEFEKMRLEMSYMNDPNEIGDRHEMGSW